MGEHVWVYDDVKYNCMTETYMYVFFINGIYLSSCARHEWLRLEIGC